MSELHLQFIEQRVEALMANWRYRESNCEVLRIQSSNRDYVRLRELQENVARNLDEKKNAFDVVNELESYFGRARVTLMIYRGTSCKSKAVSGQAILDRRSRIICHLERLGSMSGRRDEPVFLPEDGEEFPERLQQEFSRYFEAADTRSLALIPLIHKAEPSTDPNNMAAVIRDRDSKPGRLIAILAVEGLDRIIDEEGTLTEVERCREVVTCAINNSFRYTAFS